MQYQITYLSPAIQRWNGRTAIPGEVVNFLEDLEIKIIFLFATVPFTVNDGIIRQLHSRMFASLPRDCDYLGDVHRSRCAFSGTSC